MFLAVASYLLAAAGMLGLIYLIAHLSVDNREYREHVKAHTMRITDEEFERIVNQCAEHEIKTTS